MKSSRSTLLPLLAGLAAAASTVLCASSSHAVTRDEVMVRARAIANHPWRCTQSNLTASCSGAYESVYTPGDYVGLPYDWGGYMSIFTFDQGIKNGLGAGSYPADDILSCTVGLDCSGYVSQCWGSTYLTTSIIHTQSTAITQAQLLPGDVVNQAGYHVILFSHRLANGDPILYEAVGYNVHINAWGGWAYTTGYEPRRYDGITGTTAGNPIGTPGNPIPIPSLPFTDSRDTKQSSSDVFDGCGADPNKPESGPEYVYEVTLTQPGQLTVAVSDDTGVDIDVHLYSSMNTNDCTHRADSSFTAPVDCGTYYVVADTFGSGTTNAGPYTLNVTFTPSGSGCGSGPPAYDPTGWVGDPCAFPGHENLPFCNPNLGGDICLYTTGTSPISFCTHPCKTVADCPEFPGGCCKTIGSGESFCVTSPLCGGTTTDAGTPDSSTPDATVPDSAIPDATVPDSATPDSSIPDTAVPDSGVPDTPLPDVLESDSAAPDATVPHDSGPSDALVGPDGTTPTQAGGQDEEGSCACRTSAPRGTGAGWLAALVAALWLARNRRR